MMNSRLHYLGMAARTIQPVMRLAVLTCMDARIDTAALLGLRPGDAHVLRNAGGRATDEAIAALAISQAVLGTREVMVLHHTECAMGRMKATEIAAHIAAATGHPFHEKLETFADPIEDAVVDVELPLCAVDAADLAATAPLGDESLPAGRGQGERAGAPVVCGAHPLPQGALAEQWGEGAGPVTRAGGAKGDEVGRGGRAGPVETEEVECPGPRQAASLAGLPTPAQHDGSSPAAHHEALP